MKKISLIGILWCLVIGCEIGWAGLEPYHPDWEARRKQELEAVASEEVWLKGQEQFSEQRLAQLQAGTLPMFRIERIDPTTTEGTEQYLWWGSWVLGPFRDSQDTLTARLEGAIKRIEDKWAKGLSKQSEEFYQGQMSGYRVALAYMKNLSPEAYAALTLLAASSSALTLAKPSPLSVGGIPQTAPPGLSLTLVRQGSEEAKAGVRVGDVVVGVERRPVDTLKKLEEILTGFSDGSILRWSLKREGRAFELKVKCVNPPAWEMPGAVRERMIQYQRQTPKYLSERRARGQAYRDQISHQPIQEYAESRRPCLQAADAGTGRERGMTVRLWRPPDANPMHVKGEHVVGSSVEEDLSENPKNFFSFYRLTVPSGVTTVESFLTWLEGEAQRVDRRWTAANAYQAKEISLEAFQAAVKDWEWNYGPKWVDQTVKAILEDREPHLRLLREIHTAILEDRDRYEREWATVRAQE